MEGSPRHEAPRDLFDAPEKPFAFSPSQPSKLPNSKGLQASCDLRSLGGSARGLQADQENGLSHAKAATNQSEATPKAPPFSIDWVTYPIALALLTFGYMFLVLVECCPLAGISLPLPELTVLALNLLLPFLTFFFIGIESLPWRSKRREFKKFSPKATRRVKIESSGKIRYIPLDKIQVSDILFLEPGNLTPVDGFLLDGSWVACDESRLAGGSGQARKMVRDDLPKTVNKVLNEPHEEEGLKRASRMNPFILPDSWVVDSGGTCSVTAVNQNTKSRQGLSFLSGLTPPEESLGEYCHAFTSLALLVLAHPNNNSVVSSTHSQLSSFIFSGIFILRNRRRLRPVLGQIPSLSQSVVSDANSPPSVNLRHQRQPHWKWALALLALLHGAPAIALAWAPVRALRIASGVTASGSAAAVIPLRTIDGVPSWAWIAAYAVWMMCFAIYLTLQVHHIPRHRDHHRQLYLFLVLLLAIYLAMNLAQSSPILIDGFTIFGPMVLTVTTFLMALLFDAIAAMEARGSDGGGEENASGTSHRPASIAMAAMGMCT